MVIPVAFHAARHMICPLLMALLADSPARQLEPVARAKLIGGLILLTIGGVSLIVLCWLALRVGRRMSRREDQMIRRLRQREQPEDWASLPLVRSDSSEVDEDAT